VRSIGFTLADKKAGEFSLEIKSIKASDEDAAPTAKNKGGKSLVDVAASAGSFKTLLAAATAADLVDVLSRVTELETLRMKERLLVDNSMRETSAKNCL
jgi:uncharacterized surface protein with fasciclin (FAS1) repeats